MSGALVLKTLSRDEVKSSGGIGPYIYAADVDVYVTSLKREHEQQLAALQADAERYRWLRSESTYRYDGGQYVLDFDEWIPVKDVPHIYDTDESLPTPASSFDAAIDAARAGTP
jgi:hypothetical protein